MSNFWEDLLSNVKKKEEEYINIRRRFHQIPELGFQEFKTTEGICEILKGWGIEVIPLDPTGLIAYIGPKEAKTIALRADIDALAVTEETGLPFASKHTGCMHACGHDGHLTGLLGAAQYLKEIEDKLTCRVKLIFQPSEENTLGAKKIIEQGVMEDVDAVFGLHLFSDIPYGKISVEAGPRMAQTDRFSITFEGKGGHAGKPHLCVDSTLIAAEFVLAAQSIVSRQVNPVEAAVLTIGSLHSGTQYNIISPKAVLEGTCRNFHLETARLLKESIERKASAIAMSHGAKVEIAYDFGSHPPVDNDKTFSKEIEEKAKELMTDSEFIHVDPMMLGEDFSWYQTMVPGVFAFVGCGKINQESFPNHHPRFDIEEKSLIDAVALYLAAVFAFQEK